MNNSFAAARPEISVVVVVHNMEREAQRTLHSLSAAYQRHIAAEEYEVIVVDNGSSPPLDVRIVEGMAGNFRLIRLDPAPSSPARAINVGLAAARGAVIGVMIDGARIATPGLLHFARKGAQLYPQSVVATLGWYLGLDLQRWAIDAGYDKAREDSMLAAIGWPNDGYRLFEIGALDESSVDGWFATISESNALFLRREAWDALNGVEERFDAPGGGLLNIDTFRRAIELPESELVILLGEATFHQLHGGIATNADYESHRKALKKWVKQYISIRGLWKAIPKDLRRRTYVGVLPQAALVHFVRSAVEPTAVSPDGPPLGPTFDPTLWSIAPPPISHNPTIAGLVDLAESQFRARHFEAAAAVARIARAHAPDEPGPQHLLAHAGAWLPGDKSSDSRVTWFRVAKALAHFVLRAPDKLGYRHLRSQVRALLTGTKIAGNRWAAFHLARAKAFGLLGDAKLAAAEYRVALTLSADPDDAYTGLSELMMPGDNYLGWLERLHATLLPEVYFEIGVAGGQSLCFARPPTRVIGVGPKPTLEAALKTETHIFCETSDEFFDSSKLETLLAGRPIDLGFVTAVGTFQQLLKDFIHTEAHCGPRSVVLLHNTLPLPGTSQGADRLGKSATCDVWKTVVCLKHFRPDLDIFTIAAPWTGLTIVTGLDPASRLLTTKFDEVVSRFENILFADIENDLANALNTIPNDWSAVSTRLAARGFFQTATPATKTLIGK